MTLTVGPAKYCTLIAEIGINHNGSLDITKQLIDMAKKYDCDFVKFQKRDIDVVYTKETLAALRESPWGTTQRQQKEGLEFGEAQYREIDAYCKKVGIGWFASAWDLNSQKFLRKFDSRHNKIASAMITYKPFLQEVASEKKHTYISTGMATWADIDSAVEVFEKASCKYTLLHTVSTYPCAENETNISLMLTLKERYKCPVGYSGHEAGVLPTQLAIALGAEAIERHITLDRAMYGSDQAASLEARGLEIVSKFARNITACVGSGEKTFGDGERSVAKKLRYFEATTK